MTGSVNDRVRPGRQRVMSVREDRQIVLSHLRDRFKTATQTAQELRGYNHQRISRQTVSRRLREHGVKSFKAYRGNVLTPERRRNRELWCHQQIRWTQQQWKSVVFTDKSRFCVNMHDARAKVWRRKGERYANCCVRQADRWGGGSIMVWGGISWRHKTPLVVVGGNLTVQRYIDDVLTPTLVPFMRINPDVTLFQQDIARPHSARLMSEFLDNNNINVLRLPAFSPDLSPIEHLWDQIGRRIYGARNPMHSRQELANRLIAAWNDIPQYRIQCLIRSMRRRCRAVLNSNVGHTRY